MKLYQLIVGLVLMGTCSLGVASGVSLYLPINVDPVFEADIKKLAVFANITQLKRPYSVSLIRTGLTEIRVNHPELHRRLSGSLDRYNDRAGVTHASASVFHASQGDREIGKVNSRGASLEAHGELSIRAHITMSSWMLLNFGGHASDEVQQATGTLLSLGVSWAQLDVGYKDYWLSPFTGSSQLLSTQAQTLPSISLSNNMPISFFGLDFNYQFFIAELSNQPTYFGGEYSESEPPLLASAHFSVKPTPWWELGITRNFQFGGGEREAGLGTLARAFYDPRGADNTGDSLTAENEAGNQLAALSSKIHFDGDVPFSVSAEIAGEDTSNNKAYQLGNPSLTTGIYFPSFFTERLSFTYEYSNWDSSWYSHHLYKNGYSNEDFVLGHWAMQDQHIGGTALPGNSHFIGVQWNSPWSQVLDIKLRTSEHNSEMYKPSWNVDFDVIEMFENHHTLGVGAFFGQDSFGQSFAQFRISAKWR